MSRVKYWFFLTVGIIFLMDCLVLQFYLRAFNTGIIVPGIIGIIMISYSYNRIRYNENIFSRLNKNLKRVLNVLLVLFIISFIVIESLIISANIKSNIKTPEYMIVLGAGLKGEKPSLTLLKRLEKTVEFMNENPEVKAVVSGGQGFDELISESEAMKRYLVKHGINENRIIKEDKSTSTMENFKFSKEKLKQITGKKIDEAVVVTNEFHMMRARMIAERNGIKTYPLTCSTPYSVMANNFIREYFAVAKSYVMDR